MAGGQLSHLRDVDKIKAVGPGEMKSGPILRYINGPNSLLFFSEKVAIRLLDVFDYIHSLRQNHHFMFSFPNQIIIVSQEIENVFELFTIIFSPLRKLR
ncbi:hypothetical protein Plhal304r1_c031g0100601 [Plasmopara halstedii]